MAHLFNLLFVILIAAVAFPSVSSIDYIYVVTLVSCQHEVSCPTGNPPNLDMTFALNGTISQLVTLNVGDRLEFVLVMDVSGYPLTICKNSRPFEYCQEADSSDILNTPITAAGTNTSVTFTEVGTYYYGCHIYSGMGGLINVIQSEITTSAPSLTSSSLSSSTKDMNTGHQLSTSFFFIAAISSLSIIFI